MTVNRVFNHLTIKIRVAGANSWLFINADQEVA